MIERMIHSVAPATAAVNNTAIQRRAAAATANTATTTATEDAPTAQQPGAQYDFAAIFGAASCERNPTPGTTAPPPAAAAAPAALQSTIAAATTTVAHAGVEKMAVSPSVSKATAGPSAEVNAAHNTNAATAAAAVTHAAATNAAAATSQATDATAVTVTNPGIQTFVNAIMNGSFQPTYVTDPAKLQEVSPGGVAYMSNFFYASDQTANQMAQLLGGKVVQMKAFGQDAGWSEPNANFIQLPNGQTFNAADVAYYARTGVEGTNQLMADITQTINAGSAWSNYYQNGGPMPSFATGWVGPPISGMTYPPGMIGADGNVINPAMQKTIT